MKQKIETNLAEISARFQMIVDPKVKDLLTAIMKANFDAIRHVEDVVCSEIDWEVDLGASIAYWYISAPEIYVIDVFKLNDDTEFRESGKIISITLNGGTRKDAEDITNFILYLTRHKNRIELYKHLGNSLDDGDDYRIKINNIDFVEIMFDVDERRRSFVKKAKIEKMTIKDLLIAVLGETVRDIHATRFSKIEVYKMAEVIDGEIFAYCIADDGNQADIICCKREKGRESKSFDFYSNELSDPLFVINILNDGSFSKAMVLTNLIMRMVMLGNFKSWKIDR